MIRQSRDQQPQAHQLLTLQLRALGSTAASTRQRPSAQLGALLALLVPVSVPVVLLLGLDAGADGAVLALVPLHHRAEALQGQLRVKQLFGEGCKGKEKIFRCRNFTTPRSLSPSH